MRGLLFVAGAALAEPRADDNLEGGWRSLVSGWYEEVFSVPDVDDASDPDVTSRLLRLLDSSCADDSEGLALGCFGPDFIPVRTTAIDSLRPSTSVMISKSGVFHGARRVASIESVMESDSLLSTRLYESLLDEAELRKLIGERLDIPGVAFRGQLLLLADESVPFEVVRRVMYTAGQAQYGEFQIVGLNHWEQDLRGVETVLPGFGLPVIEPEGTKTARLFLRVSVSHEGIDVETNHTHLVPELDGHGPRFPCALGRACRGLDDYDWEGLTALLVRMKEEFPSEQVVYVASDDADVSWAVLVRAMDCARSAPFISLDADQTEWSRWTSEVRELFPHAIMTGGLQ